MWKCTLRVVLIFHINGMRAMLLGNDLRGNIICLLESQYIYIKIIYANTTVWTYKSIQIMCIK